MERRNIGCWAFNSTVKMEQKTSTIKIIVETLKNDFLFMASSFQINF